MGTRSTVKFYDQFNEEPILCVYQQFDGYPSGVGRELADFINSKTIINGIQSGQTMKGGFANGMGCLAAQYVAECKTAIGGFYLTTKEDSQQYNYEVRFDGEKITISFEGFEGSANDLIEYKEEESE